MKPYPPLGILSISSHIEQSNIEHEVFDSTFSSFNELKKYILSHIPDIIGVYTNLMTKINVLKLIDFIKKETNLDTKIILGGPEVRNHKDNFLKYGADIIIFGEGEETMIEVIKKIEKGLPLNDVNGIAFTEENKIIETKERPLLKKIDELRIPNRKKINLQLYLDAWKIKHGYSSISLNTMRGCPYTCKWCSRAVYGGTYRRRSPKIVIDEIEFLQANYTFDKLWFVDDVFTIHHGWLKEFHNELKKRQIIISYEIITRADRMTEEVIKLLKESGCFRVWIGAESGSQKILNAMDRRVEAKQVRDMILLSKKYKIETGTFLMLGYPGETISDIKETIKHLKKTNPDLYTITIAYPIKGTVLYNEVESHFIEQLPWERSTDRQIDFKRTYNRAFYNYAIKWVVNEMKFHKSNGLSKAYFGMKSLLARLVSLTIR